MTVAPPYAWQPTPPRWPAEAAEPRPYPSLLRGYRHRWWRSLVSLAIVVGCLAVLMFGTSIVAVVLLLASGAPIESLATQDQVNGLMAEPGFLLLNNLLLAALIPVSCLAVWGGHLWRPRWVSSVAGGIRWRLLGQCTVLSLVLVAASSAVVYALDGFPSGAAEPHAALLLAIVLLTTPLQAAGEEYFFRGWLTQTVGCLFARPVAAALVAGAVSATLFATAHGSQNIWLFLDRFAFGVLASYLAWRTGGLEAGIAAHAVNNLVVFVPVILTGGLEESLLVTDVPGGLLLADVVSLVVLGVVLTWWARRRSVVRLYRPEPPPEPVAPSGRGPLPGQVSAWPPPAPHGRWQEPRWAVPPPPPPPPAPPSGWAPPQTWGPPGPGSGAWSPGPPHPR
ncbi:MAG: CPBP family intramembrane glutamic endopeptidase [Actinomycetes bacterium]